MKDEINIIKRVEEDAGCAGMCKSGMSMSGDREDMECNEDLATIAASKATIFIAFTLITGAIMIIQVTWLGILAIVSRFFIVDINNENIKTPVRTDSVEDSDIQPYIPSYVAQNEFKSDYAN